MTDRPTFVEDEHLLYLDDLRETGVTNMFGATPYLIEMFDLGKAEARSTLGYWMKTFGREDR